MTCVSFNRTRREQLSAILIGIHVPNLSFLSNKRSLDHETCLTPPLYIEVSVTSQECERSCILSLYDFAIWSWNGICGLGVPILSNLAVMYIWIRSTDFVSFHDFTIGHWYCYFLGLILGSVAELVIKLIIWLAIITWFIPNHILS